MHVQPTGHSRIHMSPILNRNYAELNNAAQIVGTILAQSYITMTGANVQGATISLGAAVTLTGAAVHLPRTAPVVSPSPAPDYNAPVDMMHASLFVLLASTQVTNTVRALDSIPCNGH